MPPAASMLLVQDFEYWAERVLSTTAWAYYRSASDEEATFLDNREAWRRYFFRPRILRDTSYGSTATTILGIPTSMPVFIAPAAMAKLGHPLGEVNLTKAAGTSGIVQAISANASCGLEEMFNARLEGQPLIFQLYLNKDRSASSALVERVTKLGASAIILTVDVCWQSKRTLDVREKLKEVSDAPAPKSITTPTAGSKEKSVSEQISGYQATDLTWDDIAFIRKHTHLPIIVKGVQSVEDVQLCIEHGAQGVILSNHGGRQADYAPAPIDVLYELRELRPDLFSKIEVMVDGGVRSGADVVKALALGAKAVGIGRPILYANGTHGEAGVARVLQIFQEEITNTMRNIGANTVDDLKPELVGPIGPWVGRNRPSYASSPAPARDERGL
ncbi:Cytochrome b2, mitochondrial precursor [Didymella keratinophila]|nr:Cytochrome b2, mitochondrial precursor [Didymella keratinophila]